jgi:hypothetical protein
MDANGQHIEGLFAEASRHARTGDYGAAASCINSCILNYERFARQEQRRARFVEFGNRLNYSLETLLLMIERKDWVAAADVIEYEFIPLWKEAFPS